MRKYFNGKKHINSLQDAIGYESDMLEIKLQKLQVEKSGQYEFVELFEYENEEYEISLIMTWTDDDIGKPYLDTVEVKYCKKREK